MKKLFKRIVASVLTAAIAMSAAVTSVSAAMTVKGATDSKLAIEVGEEKILTISGKVGTVKAESSAAATATATLDGTTVKVKGIAAGTANVTITDDNKTADDTKDDVTVTIAVTVTKFETIAATLYTDADCKTAVTDAGVFAYVNGTKTKGDNAVDYKSVKLYAKEAATGKYVAVVTAENKQPTIDSKGKVVSDAAVKNIAKASVKDQTVTITAGKQTGTVYVWLFDMDTTKKRANSVASAKVTMKGATSSIVIGGSDVKATDKTLKTGVVGSGLESEKFYFIGAIKDAAKDVPNTLATDLTYTVVADSKNKIALTVNYDAKNNYFTVTAPSLEKDTKGKVKTASGKVTVTNVESGKKVSLTIVVGNDITATANEIKTGYATLIDEKGDVSKIDVTPTLSDSKIVTTNKVSVVVLDGEAAFNDKAKLTTAKSKTFGAKLQATETGYRVRLTNSGAKADKQADGVVYLVVTDAAKKTTYHQIATATKAGSVTVKAKGVAVVQEAPKPVVS